MVQLFDVRHFLTLERINVGNAAAYEAIRVNELHHAELLVHQSRVDACDRGLARARHRGERINHGLMCNVSSARTHCVEVVTPLLINRRRIGEVVLVLLFNVGHVATEDSGGLLQLFHHGGNSVPVLSSGK